MKEVENFIQAAGGRRIVAETCGLSIEAIRLWGVNNEINRSYLAALEKLARDRHCFSLFKKAAIARGAYRTGETK